MAEPDLGQLTVELSRLVKTLEDSENARAEADKARADAEKTRADADKARADADKVVADTETVRASARVDLEAKEIANRRAAADNEAARVDKLIAQSTGAVPDLSSLAKNTISFSEGVVLREGEAIGLALRSAAAEVAEAVKAVDGVTDLYLVSNADLLADVVTYRRIKAEADALADRAASAVTDADTALALAPEVPPVRLVGPGTALVLASVAGALGKQVASLFELDLSVTTSAGEVPARSVHAVVARCLLDPPAKAGLVLHHESARVPAVSSPLLSTIDALIRTDLQLAEKKAALQQAADSLGDPAADVAEAQKTIKDPKADPEDKEAAAQVVRDAPARVAKLVALRGARTSLIAVVEQVRAFSERVTTAPSAGGVSVLASAVAVEAVTTATTAPHVLVVGPATVASTQLVVARRIFRTRLQVSVSVSVDYFLVRGEVLRSAGRATRAVSYLGLVKGDGVTWSQATPIVEGWVT